MYYNFIPGFIGNHESFSSQLPGVPTQPFLPDLTFSNPFPTSAQSGPAANPLTRFHEVNPAFSPDGR